VSKGPKTGEPLLSWADVATLKKLDSLNYDYIDGWLRAKREPLRVRFWRWVARFADMRTAN